MKVGVIGAGAVGSEGGVDGHTFQTIGPITAQLPQEAESIPELANHELLDTQGKLGFPAPR